MGIETRLRRENYTLSGLNLNALNRILINIGMRLDQVDAIAQNPDFKGKTLKNVGAATEATDGANFSDLQGYVPAGIIAMWSGLLANIPTSWHLCDGTEGTPDLRDKFIKGVSGTNPGATGGSATHTHTAHAALSHAGTAVASHGSLSHAGAAVSNHGALSHAGTAVSSHAGAAVAAHTGKASTDGAGAAIVVFADAADKSHSVTQPSDHTVTQPSDHAEQVHSVTQPSDHASQSHSVTQPSDHASQSHSAASNEPEYFKLAFIMKL